MKIAIHQSNTGFHPRWVAYCEEKGIPYKRVNCYASDIIDQIEDCKVFMWHYDQGNPVDIIMAQPLLFALQQSSKVVFPDFNTAWHFDDKVGQKYLLELLADHFAPTWVFYDKGEALAWVKRVEFPKVFKLRGGAGSQNVVLVKTRQQARELIRKAFGSGFSGYNATSSMLERWRRYKLGMVGAIELLKGLVRFVYPPRYSKVMGKERGYTYFQEFYPENDFDIRVIVVYDKAFAIKRMNRRNDFRASGSGYIKYDRWEIDERCVEAAFFYNQKLKSQCTAYDFVFDKNRAPKLIEISYGYTADAYDDCTGYWDRNMNWYAGRFNPYGWMVDGVIERVG